MGKKVIFIVFFLLCISFITTVTAEKVLLEHKHLEFVGGYRFPNDEINGKNSRYNKGSIDIRYKNDVMQILGHRAGTGIMHWETTEPIGTGSNPNNWPYLTEVRHVGGTFDGLNRIDEEAAYWISDDEFITSGRQNYRATLQEEWIAKVNFNGTYTRYRVPLAGVDYSHQTYGAGFMRMPESWLAERGFSGWIPLGSGGYDELRCDLGPTLGLFNPNTSEIVELIRNPKGDPAPRDPYVEFVSNQLPIWQTPVGSGEKDGFWYAADASRGAAFIDHPEIKGMVWSTEQIRGGADYRSQGDDIKVGNFGIGRPITFYSPDSTGKNRGNHEADTQFQNAPPAKKYNRMYVYDPDDLDLVLNGIIQPNDLEPEIYEFDFSEIQTDTNTFSEVSGLHWDTQNQLLWVTISDAHGRRTGKFPILVAFRLDPNTVRENPEIQIPNGWFTRLDINEKNGESPHDVTLNVVHRAGFTIPSVTNYEWDFGDGNVVTTTSTFVTHTYTNPGKYNAKVTAMFSDGSTDSGVNQVIALDASGGPVCTEGETRECGIAIGACSTGTETCTSGAWGACIGAKGPSPEICGDGIDQDCNGIDLSCTNPHPKENPACRGDFNNDGVVNKTDLRLLAPFWKDLSETNKTEFLINILFAKNNKCFTKGDRLCHECNFAKNRCTENRCVNKFVTAQNGTCSYDAKRKVKERCYSGFKSEALSWDFDNPPGITGRYLARTH